MCDGQKNSHDDQVAADEAVCDGKRVGLEYLVFPLWDIVIGVELHLGRGELGEVFCSLCNHFQF